jgi:U3 small nucleolar RNA-associated protein 20
MAQDKKRKRLQVDSILPSKRSKLTKSTKNHTYESFTNRIARLKIDPIRRTHTRTVAEDDVSVTTSHFRTALDNWVELNLSEDFVKFSRAVAPLSDSLVQILHHADDIHQLLLLHIEQGTVVSLQPVLDLVSQFAHDLGVKFEEYFPALLQAIIKLAATNQEVEVIEWSFTCLAWLFKYLSKLLVPDLRPLYDVMAPLLGKSKQKVFVSRFAAESLSFLLRRASVSYHTNPTWLQTIVQHIIADVYNSRDIRSIEQFELGLISLFSEAIKGAKSTLSSNGSFIFEELLNACLDTALEDYHQNPAFQAVQGVLTALLHDTNPQTFEPILQVLLSDTPASDTEKTTQKLQILVQLVMQIACYGKGDNVKDWGSILDFLATSVDFATDSNQLKELQPDLLAAVALCHNICTADVAIRHIKILDKLSDDEWAHQFPAFCDFYSRFGNDRFQTFALPKFQRFINLHWQTYNDQLIDLIPKLASRGLKPGTIQVPQAWRSSLDATLRTFGDSTVLPDIDTFRQFAITEMLCATSDDATVTEYIRSLWQTLQNRIGHDKVSTTALAFVLGRLLEQVVGAGKVENPSTVWFSICSHSSLLILRESFWRATSKFVACNINIIDPSESSLSHFITSIQAALQSPSHEIRKHALDILAALQAKKDGKPSEILTVATTIEQTPPNIETFRSISMHIRRLGMLYGSVASDAWLSTAVPSYCFGLLRVKFAPIWDAAVSAIKEISETIQAASVVGDIALEWLSEDVDAALSELHVGTTNIDTNRALDVDTLNNDIEELFRTPASAIGHMEAEFWKFHSLTPSTTMRDRTQALLLLKAVPQLAEKKSRALVPVLLEWVRHESSNDDKENINMESRREVQKWGRKDLKAMLSVFGAFKNPKSLFKAEEVYEAILTLLGHGDAEIQRSALQAIFSRKNENINRYQEGFLNLLDDAKFKEQFTTFLTVGADEDSLRDEHRSDVMPIVLRVLFGRIISRSKGDQQKGNKRAVFSVISRLGQQEANWFLDITLGPLTKVSLLNDGVFAEEQLKQNVISQRRQLGLLNMLNDILGFLGATTAPYAHRLIDPVFYCLLRSVRDEQSIPTDDAEPENLPGKGLAKSIRSLAMHCLDHLFAICPDFDWNPYIPILWSELILPRLDRFHQETAEAVSWLLRLFGIWAKSPKYIHFLTYKSSLLLENMAQCIGFHSSKEVVKRFVVGDIFLPLLENIQAGGVSEETFDAVIACSPQLLIQLEKALSTDCSKAMLEDTVKLISKLSELSPISSPELIKTCCSLLRQPSQKVSVGCKQKLLQVLDISIPRVTMTTDLLNDIVDLLCSSFTRGISKEGRSALVAITWKLVPFDSSIKRAAVLVEQLNSFSTSRLDEPDFEKRENAFGSISELNSTFTPQEWSLLLANALYFVTDEDELSIRASASHCIRRFITVAAESDAFERDMNMKILHHTVFANIEKGLKDKPELVRAEYLSILAEMVKVLPDWEPTKDLGNLVWYDDEETSFFVNILHIQQHRRIRALGRLQEEVKKGTLASNNIAHMLVPLLEHFIFDPKGGEVAGEASRTVGALAEWMDFPQFKSLFRRYISYLHSKPDRQESIHTKRKLPELLYQHSRNHYRGRKHYHTL